MIHAGALELPRTSPTDSLMTSKSQNDWAQTTGWTDSHRAWAQNQRPPYTPPNSARKREN